MHVNPGGHAAQYSPLCLHGNARLINSVHPGPGEAIQSIGSAVDFHCEAAPLTRSATIVGIEIAEQYNILFTLTVWKRLRFFYQLTMSL